jgi:uncharacterized repeat protein (TIGR04052 family)
MGWAGRGLLAAALLAGCGGGDTETTEARLVRHEIRFRAEVNGEPFTCGREYPGVGTPAATFVASDFRFYVHDVRLVAGDGAEVPLVLDEDAFQHDGVALLDFEDAGPTCDTGSPELHPAITGTAPDRPYRGVRFVLGVPAEKNHVDPTLAPAPLNLTAMFWTWRGGYKFLRVDGRPAAAPEAGYHVHLGSTGCPGTVPTDPPAQPCTNPNRVEISLDGFDPVTGTVVADIGAVLAGSDIAANTEGTSPGCMSAPDDPDCAAILPRLGLPFGAVPSAPQVLFRGE